MSGSKSVNWLSISEYINVVHIQDVGKSILRELGIKR